MLLGLLLVALAAVSWGTTGTTLELVGAGSAAVPLVVGAMRAVVAAPLLAGGARLTRTRTRIRPRRPAFLAAGLCMAAYQVCFFSAVPLAGVAATALLAICSAPVLVTLLARLLLGQPLSRGRAAAMALGVAGAALLVGGAPSDAGPHFVLGCGLALGAGLANSLYAVVTKGALAGGTPLGLSAQTFAVAAVALLPVLEPATTVATVVRGWPLLLYLGAVPTAAAYCLYTTGLRRVPAGAAAVAGLLEPMTATVLGLLLFGERLGAPQAAGAALLLAGVCLTAAATARTAPAP